MHDSSWLSLQVGIILTENCWDCRRKNLRRIIIAAAVASLPNYLQFLRAFERPPRLKTQLLERLARMQWNQRGFKVKVILSFDFLLEFRFGYLVGYQTGIRFLPEIRKKKHE